MLSALWSSVVSRFPRSDRPRHRTRRRIGVTVATTALLLLAAAVAEPAHAEVIADSGATPSYAYHYPGSLTTSSCMNPARGFGYYGDLWVSASDVSDASFYMEGPSSNWFDPYLQVLLDRTTVTAEDDDSGAGPASYDAYLASASVTTSGYVAATSFSAGATGNYTLHSTVPLTLVTQCPQVITVAAPSSLTYGSSVEYTASTNMGQQVSLRSLTPSACTVSTASYSSNNEGTWTITPAGTGTCTLEATQAGTAHIDAAPTVESSFTVAPKALTLSGLTASKRYDGTTTASVTGTPALSGVVGTDEVELVGTITSARYASASAGTRTVTVNGLSLGGAQADNYLLELQISGEIERASQVVGWADHSLVPSHSGHDVRAATTSGDGTITYSVSEAGSAGCSLSADTLSFTDLGSCRLRATAAATSNYLEASTEITVTVAKLARNLGWVASSTWPFADNGTSIPAATADGDGTITYSVADAGDAGCQLDGRTLSFTSAGSCVLRARAPETVDYPSAVTEMAMTVTPGAPSPAADVAAIMGLRQASVSWTPSASNGGLATVRYTATAHPGGATCTTTANWCVITGLVTNTTYTFTVTAANDVGPADAMAAVGSLRAPRSVAFGTAPTTSTTDAGITLSDQRGRVFTSVTAGTALRVRATGFVPATRVAIYTYSTPVLLGQAIADADGNASLSVRLPARLDAGGHIIAAYGFSGTDGSSAWAVAGYMVRACAVDDSDEAETFLSPIMPTPGPLPVPSESPSESPAASPTPAAPSEPAAQDSSAPAAPGGTSTDGQAQSFLPWLILLGVLCAGLAGVWAYGRRNRRSDEPRHG